MKLHSFPFFFLVMVLIVVPTGLLILAFGYALGCNKVMAAQGMTPAHQQGQQVARSMLGQAQTAARGSNLGQVPQFQGISPEASLTFHGLEERAGTALRGSEVGLFLLESHHQRPTFRLDADRDPLITNAQEATQNPQRTLEVTVRAEGRAGVDTGDALIVVCEEEGEPYPQDCVIRIHPEIRERFEKIFTHCQHWGWNDWRKSFNEPLDKPYHVDSRDWEGHHDCNWRYEKWRNVYRYQKRFEATNEDKTLSVSEPVAVSAKDYQAIVEKTKTPGKVGSQTLPAQIISPESESSSCAVLEGLVERGICQYCEKVCIEPKQTRVIQGVSVTRDCWAYRQTYSCVEPLPLQADPNACQALRAKGCVQVGSVCKVEKHGVCLVYRQTYSCPKGKAGLQKLIAQGGKSLFCLTGNCTETSYEANGELFEAMSHLAVLKEAQDDIRDPKKIGIFKGDAFQCTRNIVNFRDCCGHGKGKGWGVSFGLAGCDSNEQQLALKRSENKCVRIGTYCAEKVLGVCTKKKTSFCCFGTKLARLIQEAAHRQLGLSWGTAEDPQCQGLTPDQLSRMDFSSVDFSELFQDIAARFKPQTPAQQRQSVSAERLTENMRRLVSSKDERIRQAQQRQSGQREVGGTR